MEVDLLQINVLVAGNSDVVVVDLVDPVSNTVNVIVSSSQVNLHV